MFDIDDIVLICMKVVSYMLKKKQRTQNTVFQINN